MKKYVNPVHQQMFGGKDAYFAQDVEAKPIPVPIGGWDAISPIAAMETKYAVNLVNWIPRTGFVQLRGGYNAWCQGLADGPVNTLMVYSSPGSDQVMFAACGTSIYNVSLNGMFTISKTGITNTRLQYTVFKPAGGNTNLITVNGVDLGQIYNGTTWANLNITGIATTSLINVNVFKRRIWFIQKDSLSAWYLATDAIAGAATEFTFGTIATKGGSLVAMGTWTVDGGQGPDDLAVFVTDQGQAIIYKGTNPSSADTWALVGVFDIANPIGSRCFVKIGSELCIITDQGLIPISQALPFDPSGVRSVAVTNRIQNAMLLSAQLGKNLFGWEATTFPTQALMVMNVPQEENSVQVQYVMNMLTGAWCQFNGWNANCFCIFEDSLYFGDNDGNVNLAYAGSSDQDASILADMKCAFNYFDDPGRVKNMRMLRPLIIADGTIIPTLAVDADFGDSSLAAPVTIITPSGAIWDQDLWDVASWSAGVITVNNWLSVTGIGSTLAVRMQVNIGGSGTTDIGVTSVFDTGVFDTMIFDGNGAILGSGDQVPTLQVNAFEAIMEFGGPI